MPTTPSRPTVDVPARMPFFKTRTSATAPLVGKYRYFAPRPDSQRFSPRVMVMYSRSGASRLKLASGKAANRRLSLALGSFGMVRKAALMHCSAGGVD